MASEAKSTQELSSFFGSIAFTEVLPDFGHERCSCPSDRSLVEPEAYSCDSESCRLKVPVFDMEFTAFDTLVPALYPEAQAKIEEAFQASADFRPDPSNPREAAAFVEKLFFDDVLLEDAPPSFPPPSVHTSEYPSSVSRTRSSASSVSSSSTSSSSTDSSLLCRRSSTVGNISQILSAVTREQAEPARKALSKLSIKSESFDYLKKTGPRIIDELLLRTGSAGAAKDGITPVTLCRLTWEEIKYFPIRKCAVLGKGCKYVATRMSHPHGHDGKFEYEVQFLGDIFKDFDEFKRAVKQQGIRGRRNTNSRVSKSRQISK